MFKEFKNNIRKVMESRGHWIKLSEKTAWDMYSAQSDWIDRMYNYASSDEKKLLDEVGIWNPFSNTKGVVRDHRFSRRSGFEFGVFPQILRHPCNCELITHANNVSKRSDNSQSLEELFNKIKSFNDTWIEQDLCISLIYRYLKGERYEPGIL